MTGHKIDQTKLDNGLTVLVETMPTVQSAAFCLLIPAGSAYDPVGQNGIANALADWITRGAGSMSKVDQVLGGRGTGQRPIQPGRGAGGARPVLWPN